MSFADLVRGMRGLVQPPIADIDSYWSPLEKAQASQMLACSVIGSPSTVRAGLEALRERTKADELMVVAAIYDPAARLRSYEILADVVRGVSNSRSHAV